MDMAEATPAAWATDIPVGTTRALPAANESYPAALLAISNPSILMERVI